MLSVSRQTSLLGISRQSLYYKPVDRSEDQKKMNLIDALYTKWPILGSRKMRAALRTENMVFIGREQVQRLMRLMGIQGIHPKKKRNTSQTNPAHTKYPYLLKGVTALFPNHIWGSDITYIRIGQGWAYLVAILDWYSRYVVSWKLSKTLELPFCTDALSEALHTAKPDIFNSDQGSHYTSHEMTSMLSAAQVQISMDGKGRCMDNIFTERLWRTVKYENIYVKGYATYEEAEIGIAEYITFYNEKRWHQAIDYKRPVEMYNQQKLTHSLPASILS